MSSIQNYIPCRQLAGVALRATVKHGATLRKTICAVLALAAAGCTPEVCPDGVYPGVVQVLSDRLVLEALPASRAQFLFTEPSPLLECTSIGTIALAGGPSDDRFYPSLERLGGISPDILSVGPSGEGTVESIDGFNTVIELGSIGGPVLAVTGFNSVTSIDSLHSGGRITGFNSLTDAGSLVGGLSFEGLGALERVGTFELIGSDMTSVALPRLEEVSGDFTIEQTSITAFDFPRLAHVGGDVRVSTHDELISWSGFADEARVDGDFTATFNYLIENEDILGWIEESQVTIQGTTVVCANGTAGSADPTCPFNQ